MRPPYLAGHPWLWPCNPEVLEPTQKARLGALEERGVSSKSPPRAQDRDEGVAGKEQKRTVLSQMRGHEFALQENHNFLQKASWKNELVRGHAFVGCIFRVGWGRESTGLAVHRPKGAFPWSSWTLWFCSFVFHAQENVLILSPVVEGIVINWGSFLGDYGQLGNAMFGGSSCGVPGLVNNLLGQVFLDDFPANVG